MEQEEPAKKVVRFKDDEDSKNSDKDKQSPAKDSGPAKDPFDIK